MFGQPSASTRRKLQEHGISAPATILEISDRGMALTHGSDAIVSNTEVILKTHLRVEPAGEPTFEITQKFRYPQLSVPSAGSRITVRYDADDREKIMIDLDAMPLLGDSVLARMPNGGAMLGGILETARAARSAHPGDPNAIADAVRASLGVPDGPGGAFGVPGMTAFGVPQAPASPTDQRIATLERLSALRDSGALTDAEFAAQKAAVLSS